MSDKINADDKLASCRAFLYDIEIISAVPVAGEPRDPNLHYCKGWDDHAGMGISVVCAYDFVDRAFRIYLQDNFDELLRTINSRDVIIGFNNLRFDDKVLAANGMNIPEEKSYDLWKAITKSVPDFYSPGSRSGYSLKNMLIANELPPKSGLGADAPRLAQEGKWGQLINYCLDDVRLTLKLMRLACNDVMKSPKNGGYLVISKPWDMECVVDGGVLS